MTLQQIIIVKSDYISRKHLTSVSLLPLDQDASVVVEEGIKEVEERGAVEVVDTGVVEVEDIEVVVVDGFLGTFWGPLAANRA